MANTKSKEFKRLIKAWEGMNDSAKKEFRSLFKDELLKALAEAYEMYEKNELNAGTYKKVMDAWLAQNPLYILLFMDMKGEL